MDFEKIYKELVKVVAEKHGVVVNTEIKKKDVKEKNATIQTPN